MARILIGIPCFDRPQAETFEDYLRLFYYLGRRCQEHEFFLGCKFKTEQFRARNSIVEAAYQINADYLLMLDDDHIIDIDATNYQTEKYGFVRTLINHLEDDPKLGLVGVLYYHRGGKCRPVLLVKGGEADEKGYRYLTDDEIVGGLQEVDVVGGGCMLIKMKCLDFVGAPWFEPETEFGTDFQICRKLQAAGYKVAADTSIELGHVSNERIIITSKTRLMTQTESGKVAKDLEIADAVGPVYKRFKEDGLEYLQCSESDLMRLMSDYIGKRSKMGDFAKWEDYYKSLGKPYLARAISNAKPTLMWPANFDSYLLKTIRTNGTPAIAIDYGAGPGRVTFEFARHGHLMHFFDIDGVETFEFLKWRCEKHHLTGATAFFNTWPLDNTADYAIFSDSIEHLENWQEPLLKTIQCLKPGGFIFSNFLLLVDDKNSEHIFLNKREFMDFLQENGVIAINSCSFQKVNI